MANTSLIIGSDGFIGHALTCRLQAQGMRVLETTRRQDTVSANRFFLDLAQDISTWEPPQAEIVFLLAAETSLAACQQYPEITSRINVDNTILLAKKVSKNGSRIIFLSTNRVFDGARPFRRAEEPVSPVIEYGKQKARAEDAILGMDSRNTVMRITKILPPTLLLFQNWIKRLQERQEIRAFSDMKMAPVTLDVVTGVLTQLAHEIVPGIIHISGPEDVSYFDVAKHIASRMGVPENLVVPTLSSTTLSVDIPPMEYTTLAVSARLREWGIKEVASMDVVDSVYDLEDYL